MGGRETCDELEKRKKLETTLGHCCGYVPEDPAGLLINRLAGKWAIKTSLRIELDLRRPAGVVPHSSSTREEILKIPGWSRFLCESRLLECDCLLRASQQARLPLNQGTALVEPSLSSELSG